MAQPHTDLNKYFVFAGTAEVITAADQLSAIRLLCDKNRVEKDGIVVDVGQIWPQQIVDIMEGRLS